MSSDFSDLQAFMLDCRERLEQRLEDWLPDNSGASSRLSGASPRLSGASPRLIDAMRYSVLGGGKRIRAILVYAACELAGGERQQADAAAAAIELIHAYSLVHDDLPAMDDDQLRRGRATCHIAFDEASAILAGDTLHTFAFEVLARRGDYAPATRVAMIRQLACAAGADGMAAGQMQDIQAQHQEMTLQALEEIHYLKTGRLITAALQLGLLAAGSHDTGMAALLEQFGDSIGLAFQIQDDILDVTGDSEHTGKSGGSDARLGKRTYPELLGLEESRALARHLVERANGLLGEHAGRGDRLRELAEYIVTRNH